MAIDHVMGFPKIRQKALQCSLVGEDATDDQIVDAVCALIDEQTERFFVERNLKEQAAKNAEEREARKDAEQERKDDGGGPAQKG